MGKLWRVTVKGRRSASYYEWKRSELTWYLMRQEMQMAFRDRYVDLILVDE
jgi:hypothetical protein